MTFSALLVLAQRMSDNQAPDTGPGIALILGTLLAIALLMALMFVVVSRRSKSSRGGVEPVAGTREQGQPPFESVDRDR